MSDLIRVEPIVGGWYVRTRRAEHVFTVPYWQMDDDGFPKPDAPKPALVAIGLALGSR